MGKRLRRTECRFSLRAYWFVHGLIRSKKFPIPDLAALRKAIRPYRRRQSVALYLDRDDLQTGCVWAHFSGPRAWVTHFDCPGGIGSYARSTRGLGRLPERIGFLINNGQEDKVHKSWTVPRAAGMRALEHFLLYRERDPRLAWVAEPGDLSQPAEPAAPPARAGSKASPGSRSLTRRGR